MTTTAPFATGDHVHHHRLGLGRVLSIEDGCTYRQAAVDYGNGVIHSAVHVLRRLDLPPLSPVGDPEGLPAAPASTGLDCDFCLGGYQPAGYHDELGWVYARCLFCEPECPGCDSDGLFPADFVCLVCFANQLTAAGQTPVTCTHCGGVIDILPLTVTREEIPHEH